MKYVFFLLGFLFFSSCSTYYGSTMNTKDSYVTKNEYGEFVIEGDSVDVIYNFYGQNAPIVIGVFNKTSKPFYVDWCKSGIMIDDIPTAYKESLEVGEKDNSQLVNFKYFLRNSDCLGFVKPYTRLNKQILELTNFNFQDINDSLYHKWNTEADSWGENKKFNTIRYLDTDSPIYLRTFLTVYEDSTNVNDPYYYEIDFYMSELIKMTGTSPKSIAAYSLGRGDFFYVKDEKEKKEQKPPKEKKNSQGFLSKVAYVTGQIMLWAIEGSNNGENDSNE